MTLTRIEFDAHHGYRVFNAIQEPMQVRPEIRLNNMLVVPLPDDIPAPCLNGFCSNVSRNAKLWEMDILHSVSFNELTEVALAQLWTVHAYGDLSDVQERPNVVAPQDGD